MSQPQVSPPKQIRLAVNLLASGRHNASRKTLGPAGGSKTVPLPRADVLKQGLPAAGQEPAPMLAGR